MKKIFVIIIVFFLTFNLSASVFASTSIQNGISYLQSQQNNDGSITGFPGVSDWAAQALIGNGLDITSIKTASGSSLFTYLQNNQPTLASSSSDWARSILTITAAGQNPYSFNGTNYVSQLETYYSSNQIGTTTADNDDMFALLSLLSAKEDITKPIMTDTLSFILSHQHVDGGFSYSTDATMGSDIDDTAAAIMALQAAKQQGMSNSNLDTAISNAKTYITSHQNADGGFAYDPNPATSYDTTSNVSSTAWVVMALESLGINDSIVTNAQNYISSSQQADGSFPYQPAYPPGDTFDTSYALLALENKYWPLAYYSGSIPNVTPTITLTPTPTSASPTNTPTPTPTPVVITNTVVVTATPQPSQPITTKTIYITKNIVITPTPQPQVLGAQTIKETTVEQVNPLKYILPTFFLTLSGILLGVFVWSTFLKKKISTFLSK